MRTPALLIISFLILTPTKLLAEESAPADQAAETPKINSLQDAVDQLELPGITINSEERFVDVDAEVCLDRGMLELIACIRDSKEHESIIAIDARPMHIHTALLLLGAESGSPARRIPPTDERPYWVDVLPSGGTVAVYLAFEDAEGNWTERPINDFIRRVDREDGEGEPQEKFPTHEFLFAGSLLIDAGEGPRRYIADETGHVISVVTFGDELLCLSDVHGHDNQSLSWEINPEHLPAVGTKGLLRLRPVLTPSKDE